MITSATPTAIVSRPMQTGVACPRAVDRLKLGYCGEGRSQDRHMVGKRWQTETRNPYCCLRDNAGLLVSVRSWVLPLTCLRKPSVGPLRDLVLAGNKTRQGASRAGRWPLRLNDCGCGRRPRLGSADETRLQFQRLHALLRRGNDRAGSPRWATAGLELLADVPHAWPAGLLEERKQAIRDCLERHGLAISNVNGFMMNAVADPRQPYWHPSWIEPDPHYRAIRREHTKRALRWPRNSARRRSRPSRAGRWQRDSRGKRRPGSSTTSSCPASRWPSSCRSICSSSRSRGC